MKTFLEVVKPAKPDPGIYMSASFDDASNQHLGHLQEKMGVANPVQSHKLHTTIVYSRRTIDLFPSEKLNEYARLYGIEIWDTKYGKTVVGKLDSPYLHSRFADAMSMGATYDYDEYKPHVTLAYDAGDVTEEDLLSKIQLPVDLRIVSETAETLDLDKQLSDITE